MANYRQSWKDQLDSVRGQMAPVLEENAQKQEAFAEIDALLEEVTTEVDLQERVQQLIENPEQLALDYLKLKKRISQFEVTEGTMAFGIFDHNPRIRGNAIKGFQKLMKSVPGNTKVGSPKGVKLIRDLEMKYLSDDELADDFMRPENKNKTVRDIFNKHAKRLNLNLVK
jgi:hypothetical protein